MSWDDERAVLVVVEDCEEDFDTLKDAVRASGVAAEVWHAETGYDGLALLAQATSRRTALVLMDLNTPGLDGRDALQRIKSDPALKAFPVVVFSGSANPRDLAFCYASGANAYHVKSLHYPENLATLVGLLSYWLGRVRLPGKTAQS